MGFARDGNGPDPRQGFHPLGDVFGMYLVPAGSLTGLFLSPSGEAGDGTFPVSPSPFLVGDRSQRPVSQERQAKHGLHISLGQKKAQVVKPIIHNPS